MTVAESTHHVVVSAWLQRVARGDTKEALIGGFEEAFAVLWRRSCLTLGEITLTAIVERVLHVATLRFPLLGSLEVEASGLNCQELRARSDVRVDQLAEALSFVLVELLTMLGKLTAEILTPGLHAALAKQPPNRTHLEQDERP